MNIDFLRAAMGLKSVLATCQILKSGRTAIHIIGQITDMDGKELSRATVNMVSSGMPMML